MAWKTYRVVFRLRSPLHIGSGKVGNLQRTRSYVTGRSLWGAWAMRLTRDAANGGGPAEDSRDYRRFGDEVHHNLAFTYFYAALRQGSDYVVTWPWPDESSFCRRFLSSYMSTALGYPHQSAGTGMLHEVEFISPAALDTGEPVFLAGYVFERTGSIVAWQEASKRLQIGGERGYGWGSLELIEVREQEHPDLFNGKASFSSKDEQPMISLSGSNSSWFLLAHALGRNDVPVSGAVEPLVGREWRSDKTRYRYAGQHVEYNDVCFTPGSAIERPCNFLIGKYGIWQLSL